MSVGRRRDVTAVTAGVTKVRSLRANRSRFARDERAACDGRAMSPIAAPPPAIWSAPVSPLHVTRAFRPGAPYAAGGHRGIDLRARAGATIRTPCAGAVTFRGSVAGGPPTVTIRCGDLRATLQRVRPLVGRGAAVSAGGPVGVATGRAVDLSARRADGTYVDPARLLRVPGPRLPPAVAPRRPTPPRVWAQHPANVVDRALVTSKPAPRTVAEARTVDAPLGLAGAALAGGALVALTLGAVRRRRRGAGRAAHILRLRLQR